MALEKWLNGLGNSELREMHYNTAIMDGELRRRPNAVLSILSSFRYKMSSLDPKNRVKIRFG
jgi:hypothetical protein